MNEKYIAIIALIYGIISSIIFLMIMTKKYFPQRTKSLLSEIKEEPNRVYFAAARINNWYCLRGPFLKIRLYDGYMVISHFNRAIKIEYDNIEIAKSFLPYSIGFKYNNNKYSIYPYSIDCTDYIKNKCLSNKE